MLQGTLEKLGLTASESLIYLCLLEEGALLAGRISRNTGIHRRTVYDALERLIQKGLVSYIKMNNQRYFEAAPPARLLDIVHAHEAMVNAVLPELDVKYKYSKEKRETLFFRGKASLKTLFDDQLAVGEDICIFGSSTFVEEVLPFYFIHFDRARLVKKIKVHLLLPKQLRGHAGLAGIPLCEIRFLPVAHTSVVSTNVYGGVVSHVLWRGEHSGLLIRLPELAAAQKTYFELLWKSAKK